MGGIYERGDIVYVDFGEQKGSKQAGERPALVIQNNVGNKKSPTLIVAPITSKWNITYPFHVFLSKRKYGNLKKNCVVLCEQISTINKTDVTNKLDKIDKLDMVYVERAIKISLGL